jgi:leucyl/phenylalanyl-tRNA--protein transferase
MYIPLLPDQPIFPNPEFADVDGLVGISRDLKPERLIEAYKQGIFPWFEQDDFFFWFCPNPRMVLFTHQLKVHRSMRPLINQNVFRVSFDTCFEDVVRYCATIPRGPDNQSWITENFVQAYTNMHKMGVAHSVEVWQDQKLVGGLYGMTLGAVFFGESMFSLVPNASKFGFIALVKKLEKHGVSMVDCQVHTNHLASLGAVEIPRSEFLSQLKVLVHQPIQLINW